MSAPQDHYLLAWAFSIGNAEWQPWAMGPARHREPFGQFNFDGTVFLTRLSMMGVPVVTSAIREHIVERLSAWRMETTPEDLSGLRRAQGELVE